MYLLFVLRFDQIIIHVINTHLIKNYVYRWNLFLHSPAKILPYN